MLVCKAKRNVARSLEQEVPVLCPAAARAVFVLKRREVKAQDDSSRRSSGGKNEVIR